MGLSRQANLWLCGGLQDRLSSFPPATLRQRALQILDPRSFHYDCDFNWALTELTAFDKRPKLKYSGKSLTRERILE